MFPNDFFVEFGATDGFEISNTFMLEKDFGWKGILAEPNPEWHQKLKENRREMIIDTRAVHSISGQKLNFVCTKAADLATLEEYKDSDYHSRNRQQVNSIIQVETVSLNDLLEQHSAPKEIGYISIDTEGSEYDIIKTFDFDKWNVMKFSIEHNYNDANRNRIKELMNAKGYTRVFEAFSRWDDFYEKQP
jgi:FkbM family methyltransferase